MRIEITKLWIFGNLSNKFIIVNESNGLETLNPGIQGVSRAPWMFQYDLLCLWIPHLDGKIWRSSTNQAIALFIVDRSANTEFSVGTTSLSSSTRNKTLAENAVSQDEAYSLLKQPTSKLDWSHASRCSQYWLISRPDPIQSSSDHPWRLRLYRVNR